MILRPARIGAGIIALVCAWLLLRMLESDVVRGLPMWLAISWTIALIVALVGGPILIGNGLGIFTSKTLASVGTSRAPTVRQWIVAYVGLLGAIGGMSVALNVVAGVSLTRSSLILVGAVFLVGGTGRPWWLFGTIRRTGWLALVSDDRSVRIVLGGLGVLLVAFGWLAPISV